MIKKMKPLHPGEVLQEGFLTPMNLSPIAFAKVCGVPRTRIERIIAASTGFTADTAMRWARRWNTSPNSWLNPQNEFDIRTARHQAAKEIEKIQPSLPHPMQATRALASRA